MSYACDLRQWFAWCHQNHLPPFVARRGHLELWARDMEAHGRAASMVARRLSTVAGFYRFAVIDGLVEHSPAEFVRRPKIDTESTTLGLDRMELGAFIAQGAAGSPVDHAVACLLGLLGLRVSEACGIDIDDLGIQRGNRTVTVLGKGSKLAVIPMPPRVARAVDMAAGERRSGPLLLAQSGLRLNRHAATRIVRRLARKAGSPSRYRRTLCVTHLSPLPLTRACRFGTCRSRPATPIRGPRPDMTGPATTWTATPATSSPRSSPAPPRPTQPSGNPPGNRPTDQVSSSCPQPPMSSPWVASLESPSCTRPPPSSR